MAKKYICLTRDILFFSSLMVMIFVLVMVPKDAAG